MKRLANRPDPVSEKTRTRFVRVVTGAAVYMHALAAVSIICTRIFVDHKIMRTEDKHKRPDTGSTERSRPLQLRNVFGQPAIFQSNSGRRFSRAFLA